MPNPQIKIDPLIVNLVFIMNKIPGIRTEFSCSGHTPGENGYIRFYITNQKYLLKLINNLPLFLNGKKNTGGTKIDIINNVVECRAVWIAVGVGMSGKVCYDLHFLGTPIHVHYQLIREIELSLEKTTRT